MTKESVWLSERLSARMSPAFLFASYIYTIATPPTANRRSHRAVQPPLHVLQHTWRRNTNIRTNSAPIILRGLLFPLLCGNN